MQDHLQFYIDGQWVNPVSPRSLEVINPSNEQAIARISMGSAADVDKAVAAARRAFESYSRTSREERLALLAKVLEVYQRRYGDFVQTISQEMGAPLWLSKAAQAAMGVAHLGSTIEVLKNFAFEHVQGSTAVVHEPVGVVGLITPWNFPIAIPAWKIAPALAYGNTVVFKPAEVVPGSAWALADILHRAGLPAGVFNLVMGRGSEVGAVLLEDERIAGVSFTGSVGTGQRVAAACVGRGAKVQLEMGGKNPFVVLDDADLNVAVGAAINSGFFSTGQRCTASSRVIVTEGIHDRFVAAMIEKMKTLKVDDARKAGTDIGPVVDDRQLAQDLEYIAIGQKEGAKLHGGEALSTNADGAPGFYLRPALFTETTPEMRINREEIFGPVVSIQRVKGYDEALALANDTPFGLASGIATTSLKHATHFKRHAQAGMVMVNLPTAGVDYHVPFGGRKGSSYGSREQGRYAAEFYTTVKTAYIQA